MVFEKHPAPRVLSHWLIGTALPSFSTGATQLLATDIIELSSADAIELLFTDTIELLAIFLQLPSSFWQSADVIELLAI